LSPSTWLWLCCAALGCESDAAAKAEAGKLSHALDVLREADNAQKASALAELRAVGCTQPETCGVQSACVAAYEAHVRGLEGIAQSKRLAHEDAGPEVPALLESARESLERAKGLAQKCADAQGELVRRYRLR
jgi:hypothetical protein